MLLGTNLDCYRHRVSCKGKSVTVSSYRSSHIYTTHRDPCMHTFTFTQTHTHAQATDAAKRDDMLRARDIGSTSCGCTAAGLALGVAGYGIFLVFLVN